VFLEALPEMPITRDHDEALRFLRRVTPEHPQATLGAL
jgi:hypothetical protein